MGWYGFAFRSPAVSSVSIPACCDVGSGAELFQQNSPIARCCLLAVSTKTQAASRLSHLSTAGHRKCTWRHGPASLNPASMVPMANHDGV
jgi:hypothetical protein